MGKINLQALDEKKSIEPLHLLLNKNGIDISKIKSVSTGAKYSAVMLKNGNIGVCANIGNVINITEKEIQYPDLDNVQHRILITAYFNALINYSNIYQNDADIFDIIDFTKYQNIHMTGLFRPIVKKFRENNISLTIFDLIKNDPNLSPISEQMENLKNADAVILSSTTLFNNTFLDFVNNTNIDCDIYMLGPSSIMSKKILQYRNIKIIFGSVFKKHDKRILKIIEDGGGTQKFQKFGRKVYFGQMSSLKKGLTTDEHE